MDVHVPRSSKASQPSRLRCGCALWYYAFVLAMILLAAMLPLDPSSRLQGLQQRSGVPKEYKVKVAYLYNFSRYIKWPEDAFPDDGSPFVIGVLGDAPFGSTLDKLARKKKVNDRKIVTHRFKSLDELKPCHILFVSRSADPALQRAAIQRTKEMPLLIVGESTGMAHDGAPVNFYPDQNGTVGFEVNVDALAQRKLQADAKLLKLARVITNSK